ncbi:MAG: hypothetical protein RL220_213 [Bacteroidota bacterium]|jgi:hypothetical protein
MKQLWFILIASCIVASAPAQSLLHNPAAIIYMDDEDLIEEEEEEDPWRGWSIGLNLGGYFGSGKTGNFYNGLCGSNELNDPNDVRCYTIEERLTLTPNEINYINTYFGSSNFFLPWDAYPARMRYNPAFMLGFQLKYNFNRDAALVFNSNAVRMKAVDQFTIQFVGTPLPPNGQADVRLFQIVGKEDRFNFNLGYRQGFMINDLLNSYIQIGGSVLGTKVMENEVFVADRTYDLFLGFTNPNQAPIAYQPRTGFGFGYYFSLGVELFTTNRFTADLSLGFSRDKMKLITYEEKGWNKWLQATVTM